MKALILISTLFSSMAFADVVIHKDVFSLEQAPAAQNFYGRIYKWSSWEENEISKSFDVSPNPIKQAFEAGFPDQSVEEPSEADLVAVFPGEDGEALADYYLDSDELDKGIFCFDKAKCPYREAVFNSKVSISLGKDFDFSKVSLEALTKSAIIADQPHAYSKVSKKIARGFLNPVHLGHDQIQNHPNEEVYFSILNFGYEQYQCASLNTTLNISDKSIIAAAWGSAYRIFNISLLREVGEAEVKGLGAIEGSPIKVFEQKIINSTKLIKSAVNYISFYELPNGEKKMVLYSVVVSSSKVAKAFKMFINGQSENKPGSILFNGAGEAVLDQNNLDLTPISGECSKGLGSGLGRYIYGLARKIVNQ